MSQHAADLFFAILKSYGVRQIFGIPGDELEIFDALAHSGIEFITTRHEQAAAFMAEAVGKTSSQPAVCISTLGPGATNLITGVANAYQNRIPMLVLSGQLERKFHKDHPHAHQYINLSQLFAPITKATYTISNISSMQRTINKALRVAGEGVQGPVHITLPIDIMEQEVHGVAIKKKNLQIKSNTIGPNLIKNYTKLLLDSSYPVAFLGNKGNHVDMSFRDILQKSHIPVMTSFMGKGSFSEKESMSLGTVSRHLNDELSKLVKKADLMLVVDYDYIEGVQPEMFKNKKIIYVNSYSAKDDALLYPVCEIIGRIDIITKRLAQEMRHISYSTKWNETEIIEVKKKRYQQILNSQQMNSFPFNPFRVMQVLQQVTTGDEVIVSDVGNHKQALGLGYDARRPHHVHFSNGLSSMGFSLPFSAGLRFTLPNDKTIISINGDGGFLMNVQELETIRRYNLNIKIIIFVDNAFGMIKSNLLAKYKRVKNLDFTNPDFHYLARSFGFSYFTALKKETIGKIVYKFLNTEGTAILTIPVKY
jgi:acetolactate synthase I/II/III large subunit